MVSSVKDAAWLAWIERLVGESEHPRATDLPRSLFHCRLDDQPDHLVPERHFRSGPWEGLPDRPLFLNHHCFLARDGKFPDDVCADPALLDAFALQGEMIWIKDGETSALRPFWLGPGFSSLLHGLHPGDAAPSTLSPQAARILAVAEVLVPGDYDSIRARQWSETVSSCSTQFRQKGYAPIAGLIHPFLISALRRYYRNLIRTGKIDLGDGQSSLRYVAHNESVARFFHRQLAPAVSAIAGEPVKPSYVYMASYQPGAILKKHTDREQCEFSITLCVDYSPEPCRATPWPLHLHTRSSVVTVFQGLGDGLLYRGRELPHARDPLPDGHTSTSIFFHYVRAGFSGPLD
jgi:hypothetical protein